MNPVIVSPIVSLIGVGVSISSASAPVAPPSSRASSEQSAPKSVPSPSAWQDSTAASPDSKAPSRSPSPCPARPSSRNRIATGPPDPTGTPVTTEPAAAALRELRPASIGSGDREDTVLDPDSRLARTPPYRYRPDTARPAPRRTVGRNRPIGDSGWRFGAGLLPSARTRGSDLPWDHCPAGVSRPEIANSAGSDRGVSSRPEPTDLPTPEGRGRRRGLPPPKTALPRSVRHRETPPSHRPDSIRRSGKTVSPAGAGGSDEIPGAGSGSQATGPAPNPPQGRLQRRTPKTKTLDDERAWITTTRSGAAFPPLP